MCARITQFICPPCGSQRTTMMRTKNSYVIMPHGYHTNTLGISFADAYGISMTRSKRPSFGELMNSCINCLNKTSSSFPRRMPWIQDNIAITRNTGMHAAGIRGRIRFSCGKLWGFLNSEADERLHISFKRWPKMFPRWSSLVIR